jgi:hypothetical protein
MKGKTSIPGGCWEERKTSESDYANPGETTENSLD